MSTGGIHIDISVACSSILAPLDFGVPLVCKSELVVSLSLRVLGNTVDTCVE